MSKNLDLDMILEQHEYTHIPAFHKDNLMYVLNLIAELPSMYKDRVNENGYVPIIAKLLRDWIGRDYQKYIILLIQAGIIESDNWYVPVKKSIGYRYTSRYNAGVKRMLITDTSLYRRFDEHYGSSALPQGRNLADSPSAGEAIADVAVDIAVYEPANRWYSSGLIKIDHVLANAYNRVLRDYKLADEGMSSWDYEANSDDDRRYKHPMVQLRAGQISIDKIATGRFFQHYDDNIFRYHSTVTQCKRELRNAITIDGQSVVSIDF